MKGLIAGLFLVAAGYTGYVFYLIWMWRDEVSKMSATDLLFIGVYSVPILALWVSSITLWKVTKRPTDSTTLHS